MIAPCVAPTYPEFVGTEDGDWVWVRRDLAHDPDPLVEAWGVLDDGNYKLVRQREVAMSPVYGGWWDVEPGLAVVDPAMAQDAAIYVQFEVCAVEHPVAASGENHEATEETRDA